MVPERDFPSHFVGLTPISHIPNIDSNMADKPRRKASDFKRLTDREQVLQCPDMYIGSMVPVTEDTLVYDYKSKKNGIQGNHI